VVLQALEDKGHRVVVSVGVADLVLQEDQGPEDSVGLAVVADTAEPEARVLELQDSEVPPVGQEALGPVDTVALREEHQDLVETRVEHQDSVVLEVGQVAKVPVDMVVTREEHQDSVATREEHQDSVATRVEHQDLVAIKVEHQDLVATRAASNKGDNFPPGLRDLLVQLYL
jgi:hypothetical protein